MQPEGFAKFLFLGLELMKICFHTFTTGFWIFRYAFRAKQCRNNLSEQQKENEKTYLGDFLSNLDTLEKLAGAIFLDGHLFRK